MLSRQVLDYYCPSQDLFFHAARAELLTKIAGIAAHVHSGITALDVFLFFLFVFLMFSLALVVISSFQAFMTFADTADAVAASTEMIDSKMGKNLKKFLTKNIVKKELKDKVSWRLATRVSWLRAGEGIRHLVDTQEH